MIERGTKRSLLLAGMVGLLGTACTGEPRVMEPRTPPPRYVPRVAGPAAPLQPGAGRVVLDTTEGPMRVSVRADRTFIPPGATIPPTRSGELCVTPCAADLPAGRYDLFLVSADGSVPGGDVDTLEVQPGGVNYHIRAPGHSEPREWLPAVPIILTIVGTAAVVGGVVMLAADGDTGYQVGGGALMVGGAITIGAGGIMYYNALRGTQQEGASTHWWEPLR